MNSPHARPPCATAIHDRHGPRVAAEMAVSVFCLMPAGDNSVRSIMYSAIAAGCLPVILCDGLRTAALPFHQRVPWEKVRAPSAALSPCVCRVAAAWPSRGHRVATARPPCDRRRVVLSIVLGQALGQRGHQEPVVRRQLATRDQRIGGAPCARRAPAVRPPSPAVRCHMAAVSRPNDRQAVRPRSSKGVCTALGLGCPHVPPLAPFLR